MKKSLDAFSSLERLLSGTIFRYRIKNLLTSYNMFDQLYEARISNQHYLGIFIEKESFLNYGLLSRRDLLVMHRDIINANGITYWNSEKAVASEAQFFEDIYKQLSSKPEVAISDNQIDTINIEFRKGSMDLFKITIKSYSNLEIELFDFEDKKEYVLNTFPPYKTSIIQDQDDLPF